MKTTKKAAKVAEPARPKPIDRAASKVFLAAYIDVTMMAKLQYIMAHHRFSPESVTITVPLSHPTRTELLVHFIGSWIQAYEQKHGVIKERQWLPFALRQLGPERAKRVFVD